MNNQSSEKYIEHKLVEGIKNAGGLCIKLLTYQFAGLPDRLCLMPMGKMCFVELKSTGKKPRKLQISVHSMLKKIGFDVVVVDSVEGAENLIQKLKSNE